MRRMAHTSPDRARTRGPGHVHGDQHPELPGDCGVRKMRRGYQPQRPRDLDSRQLVQILLWRHDTLYTPQQRPSQCTHSLRCCALLQSHRTLHRRGTCELCQCRRHQLRWELLRSTTIATFDSVPAIDGCQGGPSKTISQAPSRMRSSSRMPPCPLMRNLVLDKTSSWKMKRVLNPERVRPQL